MSGWTQSGFRGKEPGKFGYVKYGKMKFKINFVSVYKLIKKLVKKKPKPVTNE
ncbi:MAG: hypothetical protein IPM51_12080 [Sphingobacteriaceae bacterium]|nr:hypothetical protein [Sphingobacteriaceae bacterium]